MLRIIKDVIIHEICPIGVTTRALSVRHLDKSVNISIRHFRLSTWGSPSYAADRSLSWAGVEELGVNNPDRRRLGAGALLMVGTTTSSSAPPPSLERVDLKTEGIASDIESRLVGSSGAPSAVLSLGSGGAVNEGGWCPRCGGQRFGSPQLQQEVGANGPGFPAALAYRALWTGLMPPPPSRRTRRESGFVQYPSIQPEVIPL
jgi:hypothetical protein